MHHKKYIEILQKLGTEKCQKYIHNPTIFTTFLLQFLLHFTAICASFPLQFSIFSIAILLPFQCQNYVSTIYCILKKTRFFKEISLSVVRWFFLYKKSQRVFCVYFLSLWLSCTSLNLMCSFVIETLFHYFNTHKMGRFFIWLFYNSMLNKSTPWQYI